ncbi:hypothetical protein H4P1_00054 (plasmid) [Variovorax sp. PBS-H4]|uniref:hypothetical protein n=1 Tax=Variovorax sp. PBS-H4 TaxID=434008 RepID=UPI001316619E|nr:hypothetical protein [Variovorax sp. PBS-H4]VTU41422.1 hypothetical protein H4P1_00054 [Variovorax sp. PBS-H4]
MISETATMPTAVDLQSERYLSGWFAPIIDEINMKDPREPTVARQAGTTVS